MKDVEIWKQMFAGFRCVGGGDRGMRKGLPGKTAPFAGYAALARVSAVVSTAVSGTVSGVAVYFPGFMARSR